LEEKKEVFNIPSMKEIKKKIEEDRKKEGYKSFEDISKEYKKKEAAKYEDYPTININEIDDMDTSKSVKKASKKKIISKPNEKTI